MYSKSNVAVCDEDDAMVLLWFTQTGYEKLDNYVTCIHFLYTMFRMHFFNSINSLMVFLYGESYFSVYSH